MTEPNPDNRHKTSGDSYKQRPTASSILSAKYFLKKYRTKIKEQAFIFSSLQARSVQEDPSLRATKVILFLLYLLNFSIHDRAGCWCPVWVLLFLILILRSRCSVVIFLSNLGGRFLFPGAPDFPWNYCLERFCQSVCVVDEFLMWRSHRCIMSECCSYRAALFLINPDGVHVGNCRFLLVLPVNQKSMLYCLPSRSGEFSLLWVANDLYGWWMFDNYKENFLSLFFPLLVYYQSRGKTNKEAPCCWCILFSCCLPINNTIEKPRSVYISFQFLRIAVNFRYLWYQDFLGCWTNLSRSLGQSVLADEWNFWLIIIIFLVC